MDQDQDKNPAENRCQTPTPGMDRGRETEPDPNLTRTPEQSPRAETSEVSALLEALLFVSSRPLPVDLLEEVTGLGGKEILEALKGLGDGYRAQERGFTLEEVAGGYQLRTREEFAQAIVRLHQSRARRRFTRFSLETLAIVAYRQPASRAEIEHIRGVDCGAVLKGLLAQSMIRVLGRKETPGRPILYGTTREFLEYFGLRDIESLPTLQEVTELLEEGEQARAAEGPAGPTEAGAAVLEGAEPGFPAEETEEAEEAGKPGDLEGETE